MDGDAVVVDGTRYEYDHLIVAVGTEPAGLPGIDMDNPAVLTSNDVLVMPDGALLVSDDHAGALFRVSTQR